jgi:hypothetical protein
VCNTGNMAKRVEGAALSGAKILKRDCVGNLEVAAPPLTGPARRGGGGGLILIRLHQDMVYRTDKRRNTAIKRAAYLGLDTRNTRGTSRKGK